MGKAQLGHLTNPIDLVSKTPDIPDQILKHRTCWLQVLANLRSRRIKTSRQQLKNFELNAPCFLDTIPCRKRSTRTVKCKNEISKLQNRKQNKLDSGEFECHLEFVLDIYRAEHRPVTKEAISRIPLLVPKMEKNWFSLESMELLCKKLKY
ncbi:hypothetical protein Patl1_18231 [Pistacia atlantica]|uniref:Uncharacterized protein n=1 Tax=Pistacia atlantica TaxID=434234 RepID=A0ACC1C2B5_9ROSI|nr:hypothetical protein Patl1_18231 [Pistacia atlantica]